MYVFYGSGLGVYTHAIQQLISDQWETIAYAEDLWIAMDVLDELKAANPTPDGSEPFCIVNCV